MQRAEPFLAAIQHLGADNFAAVLKSDPKRESTGGSYARRRTGDSAARGPVSKPRASRHSRKLISDLYDGFLSAEDRRGVKTPDFEVIAPLVKWGSPDSGPYTWPVDATRTFGLTVGVVNLPPSNARLGLCAWAALGHECGGHDILHADRGLLSELDDRVGAALVKAKLGTRMANYWSSRIDETASDVLGVLNLGPAAGIGLIAYFRGINAALGLGAEAFERRTCRRSASGRPRARVPRRGSRAAPAVFRGEGVGGCHCDGGRQGRRCKSCLPARTSRSRR